MYNIFIKTPQWIIEMTVQTATFRVDGRHYSNIARQFVLDGDWRKGLKLLVDSFEGMTHDIAFHILKGTHILEGTVEINLIEEVDEEYQSDMHDIYCHDMFYQDGQLYRFQQIIEQKEIQNDIYTRGLTFDIPDADEYVIRYLLPKNMISFDVTTTPKRFRALIASKEDNNSLPLWFNSDDFSRSAKAYTIKFQPEQKSSVVKKMEAKQNEAQENTGKDSDWYKSFRKGHAEQIADAFGFKSAQEFSEDLRSKVMAAIKERGVQWRELLVQSEGVDEVISYPYELALRYALVSTPLYTFAPDWDAVCPGEIKQSNDSQIHSDLWLALGNSFDGLEYIHDSRENIILSSLVRHLQKEFFPAGDFLILNSAGLKAFTGKVVTPNSKEITKKDILVIPHAGPEFDLLARRAGLVICEVGGRLAHLVIVGREFGLPLVRVDDACKTFREGVTLTLDFETAEITASKQ